MTLATLFDNIIEHDCFGKRMIPADDPMKRVVGWVCINCGERFEMRLVEIKFSDCPDWAHGLVLTNSGRLRLAMLLTAGYALIVNDEVLL